MVTQVCSFPAKLTMLCSRSISNAAHLEETKMSDSDHLELTRLLKEAKPLLEPMYADQKKQWISESPLAEDISELLARHPEYYDEISAHVGAGIFPKPKS
jgi:hypothetical protein